MKSASRLHDGERMSRREHQKARRDTADTTRRRQDLPFDEERVRNDFDGGARHGLDELVGG
jgi:hypothetical protein